MSEEIIIDIKNISVFQKDSLVLSDVSFEIKKGEFVYLIGKTGAGKSSLLKILYAELPIESGQAKIAGFDLLKIKKKNIPYLRRKIGIVFQDFKLLYDRTVYDNLIFVMKATGWKNKAMMQERVTEVLNLVGLGTKGFKMPHQLSGGEQQRVCIARALINKPEIIFADEPTGNLDPNTSAGIVKLLFDISKTGTSVFFATHDYVLIQKFPSRIISCENGHIFCSEDLC